MNFLKSVLASILGFWVAIILILIIGIVIAANFAMPEIPKIENNSILELSYKGALKDYVSVEDGALNNLLNINEEIGFNQLLKVIDNAKGDDRIKGISIGKLPSGISWAQLTELRKKLQNFKETGKPVWAYADVLSQKEYYLSSVADTLALSPTGQIDLKGLHLETLFFKNFQEKYGFKMEVIRHGKYKSAVEPFIADEMSEENRLQISELINSMWQQIKMDIESSRQFNIDDAVRELTGNLPTSALKSNLIDALWYKDDYVQKLKALTNKDAELLSLSTYIQGSMPELLNLKSNAAIATIYAQGEIIYGEGSKDRIGPNLITEAFKEAVENEDVKAIVLRIDSPGGSALSSDLIWNAVEKAKKIKPVVVSMGNVAASGGYYIACNATTIFAEPTTITGSIGVFGILPNASELAKKNGINSETVSTHDNNANYSVVQSLNPNFKEHIKESIEFIYDTFVDRVAEGRNMTTAAVDSIAQGRVWTGTQAKNVGLVDQLGGLQAATDYAAQLAEVDSYNTIELPKYEMDIKDLLSGGNLIKVLNRSKNNTLLTQSITQKVEQIQFILETEGVQARLPFEMAIE